MYRVERNGKTKIRARFGLGLSWMEVHFCVGPLAQKETTSDPRHRCLHAVL